MDEAAAEALEAFPTALPINRDKMAVVVDAEVTVAVVGEGEDEVAVATVVEVQVSNVVHEEDQVIMPMFHSRQSLTCPQANVDCSSVEAGRHCSG